ncbi:Hypothetical predicted protein [Pelobates cultripes]|uniref:Uncharacterized protein n=1 Tax=Pelobates cultripes TaxID=61616 RepID=A0AAD1SBL1_PELCU|nr:Hypothetical predicted protein [Pelobates cultripes]
MKTPNCPAGVTGAPQQQPALVQRMYIQLPRQDRHHGRKMCEKCANGPYQDAADRQLRANHADGTHKVFVQATAQTGDLTVGTAETEVGVLTFEPRTEHMQNKRTRPHS